MAKSVFKPVVDQPLISVISSGCITPILEVKFCSLFNPYYYPNSPTIPRRSVTCIVDPKKHKDFLTGIQTIEKNEKVETIIKHDTKKEDGQQTFNGLFLIKFQSKDQIPIFVKSDDPNEKPLPIALEGEIGKGEKVQVVYEILRYTKKGTAKIEHGLSFKPTTIYWYPEPAEAEHGDC